MRWSERSDGDFHLDEVDPHVLDRRRRRLVDLPWSQPNEVHGADVAVVSRPGEHDRADVDALVTGCRDAVLGIWTGDCAPVAIDGGSVVGAAHAGWRGIAAGVLEATVQTMRSLGAQPRRAVLGPCIHPCCYEFGLADLEALVTRLGPEVRSTTSDGRPALDLPAAARLALAGVGVDLDDRSSCTGCEADRWFSHRVRGERQRQVMAVWRSSEADGGAQ